MTERIAVGALIGLAVFLLAGRMMRRRSAGTASRDIMTLIGLLTWRPIRRVLAPNRRGLIIADRLLWSALEAGVRSPQPRLARSPYPLPVRARMHGRNCRVTVRIPAGMDVPMLAEAAPLLGGGCQAQAVTVQPWEPSPMAYADIDIMYRRLQPGRRVETVEAPDSEGEIMVGLGMAGPVTWELDDEAHLGIYGPSGAGKGVLARWVALQWVDPAHGRELVIIDGQGAPEWSALADVPGVTVLQFDPAQPVESLTAIVAALDTMMLAASSVAALCAEHCVDGWRHLPDDIKRLRPRRLLMCDELTALLGKVPADDPTAKLRKAIGYRIGTGLRTVRKAGIHIALIDQVTYAGDETYLTSGALGQVGRWALLGPADDSTAEMVTGSARLPWIANQKGLGITGRRGDPAPLPIEIPWIDRPCLARTITAWGSAGPVLSGDVVPEGRPAPVT